MTDRTRDGASIDDRADALERVVARGDAQQAKANAEIATLKGRLDRLEGAADRRRPHIPRRPVYSHEQLRAMEPPPPPDKVEPLAVRVESRLSVIESQLVYLGQEVGKIARMVDTLAVWVGKG